MKELDLTLSYTFKQLEVQLIHYYYFEGSYFDLGLNNDGGTQLEATIKYTMPQMPLQFVVSTNVAGCDPDPETGDRAYSTYLEANYTWEWENPGVKLQAVVGATPWRGMYSGEYKSGICNISARADKEWTVGNATVNLQLCPMFSPTFEEFNWCVGLGVEF